MVAKLELTQKLVEGLRFDRMIVGTTKAGRPIAEDTPPGKHDWIVRDGGNTGQPGLLLRVTPGAVTWCVQKKMGGVPKRLAMGRAQPAPNYSGRVLTVDEARKRARLWLADMERNIDPLHKKAENLRQSRLASEQRRVTMAVAMEELIEAKRKHKAKLGEETLEIGVGKRRTADPKLRDESTKDRKTVQRWMEGSPLWHVPLKDLNEDHVAQSLDPLLRRAAGRKEPVKWGPASVSKGTMDKIYAHLSAAWMRAQRQLKLGLTREEGPLYLWRSERREDWPADRRVEKALETGTPEGAAWLRALWDLRTRTHDAALFHDRPDPRMPGLKPHMASFTDFYLLLVLWGTRATETMLLEWRNIDFDRRLVWLSSDTTKSGVAGVVPLTAWAIEILKQRKDLNERWRPDQPGSYVFPSREHGRPISSPRSVLVALAKETGLMITAHDLRRALARELGDENDLAHAAKLLITGAALNHGAGKGGSRTQAVTERYLGQRADILRPLYQQREDRLRQILSLPVLSGPQRLQSDADEMIARMKEDPEFRRRVLESAFTS